MWSIERDLENDHTELLWPWTGSTHSSIVATILTHIAVWFRLQQALTDHSPKNFFRRWTDLNAIYNLHSPMNVKVGCPLCDLCDLTVSFHWNVLIEELSLNLVLWREVTDHYMSWNVNTKCATAVRQVCPHLLGSLQDIGKTAYQCDVPGSAVYAVCVSGLVRSRQLWRHKFDGG